MTEIARDPSLVAHCGLYCGACGAYMKGRCPGCQENTKATWCKVRSCCQEHAYRTCADCKEHQDPKDCRSFHNVISRVIGLVLNSDRGKCIARLRAVGVDAYTSEMAERGLRTLPRRGLGA